MIQVNRKHVNKHARLRPTIVLIDNRDIDRPVVTRKLVVCVDTVLVVEVLVVVVVVDVPNVRRVGVCKTKQIFLYIYRIKKLEISLPFDL